MHEFAEEFVANLKPKEDRYDSRLGDDFYVSTFPNGIRTWVYLYDVGEYKRRRTLGIYPEMPLSEALEALYTARRTLAVELELMEQGLDGSKVVRNREAVPKARTVREVAQMELGLPDRRYLVGALAGLVIGIAGGYAMYLFSGGRALTPVTSVPVASTAVPQPAAAAPRDNVTGEALVAAGATDNQVSVLPDDSVTAATSPELAPGADNVPPAVATTGTAGEEGSVAPANPEVMEMQRDLAGTLAWSQLTSDVVDGEPVDELGWIIDVEQPRRVFYFVSVRGMAEQDVTYSWFHEDQLVREDVVRLGSGWHSQAYSGVTLTPERVGRWRVEITTPRGALGGEEFELRLAASG